jgi:N-acetyl-alpha-D-glucosaminyl L-malate synthase BshA
LAGSGVFGHGIGKGISTEDHQVHFITYQQPVRLNGFIPNIFYHEFQVPTCPLFDYPPYETALASTMVDVIRNNNLDLLHVHYAIPHASAAYLAKQILKKENKEIPVITTLHGTDITLVGRDKMYSPVVTFSINQSDAITAVSKNLRDETYKIFKIEKRSRLFSTLWMCNASPASRSMLSEGSSLPMAKGSYCMRLISGK